MKLIDADALIPGEVHTVVVRKLDGQEVWESVLYAEQIDDAPTIEAIPISFLEKLRDNAQNDEAALMIDEIIAQWRETHE